MLNEQMEDLIMTNKEMSGAAEKKGASRPPRRHICIKHPNIA
jgi:hypothetical protein